MKNSPLNPRLVLGEEIRDAREQRRPVVTLESTIIAFGLPWPRNLETALECEEIIRAEGAIPATVGIVDGRFKVGLTRSEIETFAKADNISA